MVVVLPGFALYTRAHLSYDRREKKWPIYSSESIDASVLRLHAAP